MRFWDSSAIVPLLISEDASARIWALAKDDPGVAVWWATRPESLSALVRRRRMGQLSAAALEDAISRLHLAHTDWIEIPPTIELRTDAERLLRAHPLRAADALQLAAALTVANGDPASLGFVCLDDRLADAARQEGFAILPA